MVSLGGRLGGPWIKWNRPTWESGPVPGRRDTAMCSAGSFAVGGSMGRRLPSILLADRPVGCDLAHSDRPGVYAATPMAVTKVRLDQLLAQRGLFPSRSRAAASVMAGEVRLGDEVADKPGRLVAEDVAVLVASGRRFVSRGGIKLANALDSLGLDPAGRDALDVGAS